jgi:hypothetical protein
MMAKWLSRLLLAALLTALVADGAAAQAPAGRIVNGPKNILGRNHPGRITQIEGEGLTVDLRDGGVQSVQFDQIWRIRRAFASDEPTGTSVIDFANNRLFVTTPLQTLVEELSKKVPITKLTAPNGDAIYMVASKVTDISNALPGLHNPLSKSVIGTRDGIQQVVEPADAARQIIAAAHVTQ